MNEIIEIPIKQHMEKSALDYAMSVIAARALPDVRDGLKPVHRRILWAMYEMGMTPEKQTKKSAGVVGEVLKLYHPHGDTSVYDAAVRMAQPWSLLHPLIIGQGNFGSVDGDGAAAYRYTEMKLAPIAMRFFEGIDKQAVDMVSNFDGQAEEPVVLPVAFPNILVNGSEGIAVGMSTSVPPHNLREVGAAVEAFLDNPAITPAELSKILIAPDFPTGGIVHGLEGYVQALETGRGRVMLRATWREEKTKTKTLLIIDSIPYQQKKSKIHEAIGALVNDKKLDGVSDVRDETSSKAGLRLVVELKKDVSAELVFNQLLGHKIGLEVSFNYNMMLLDGTQPIQMNILDIFRRWLAFRIENIQRATQFNLNKALAHLHLLEGLIEAIGVLDKVIAIARNSEDARAAQLALMELIQIDEIQANAILAMTLRRLTGLELEAIRSDHKKTVSYVADLKAILASDSKQIALVREALRKAVDQFGCERQTAVEHSLSQLNREDLISKEDAVVITTANGYVKRVPTSAIQSQNRGTRGKSWMTAGDDDAVTGLHVGSTHDYLMVITSTGKIYSRKVYEIPESSAGTKGRHIRNIIPGIGDERIVKMLTVTDFEETSFLITVSNKGQIKRTKLSEYVGSNRESGIIALLLDSGDELAAVEVCRTNDTVILVASNGKAIRFVLDDSQLRPMGRASVGNRGIRIGATDKVIGMVVVPAGTDNENTYLFCMGQNAVGKKTPLSEFTAQTRGGQGVTCFNTTPKTGDLVKAMGVSNTFDLVFISQKGVSNRIGVSSLRKTGRITSGVKLMNLDAGDRIAEVSLVLREEE